MSRTHEQLMRADLESLMLNDSFKRFIYCVLMDANVLRGGYGANQATLQWWEGRRSLGLDILATMQTVNPDALLAILSQEQETRKETTNGRRKSDRRTELDPGGGDPDGRSRSDGIRYLDYGGDGAEG